MQKLLKMGGILLGIGLIILYVILSHVLPYSILKPGKQNGSWSFNSPVQMIDLLLPDSILLSGSYLLADDTAIGNLLFVHGVGSCKEAYEELMRYYAQKGINAYAFDMRAHGKSGGEYATYGYHEKEDIREIVEWIRQNHGSDIPLGIYGNSMGGAISIQATAEIPQIDFAVFESAFADFPEIVNDYSERISRGLTMKWMVNWVLSRAGKIADFVPKEVAPERAAVKIDKPVLVIHGDADDRIHVSHAHRIFDNLSSIDKELYIVEGGGHADLGSAGGEAYWRKLDGFIFENMLSRKQE